MDINTLNILDLIPQRRPFVMVDRLVECDDVNATSEFLVKEDNLFCKDGRFLESGMMENIAQTCAARIGFMNLQNGGEVKIGMIGAVKNLQFVDLPQVGDKLTTKIKVKSEVFSVTLIDAELWCNDKMLAKGDMKVAIV